MQFIVYIVAINKQSVRTSRTVAKRMSMSRIVSLPVTAFLLFAAMATPVYAYVDPGTGSIVLQAIIGGIAASMFIVRGRLDRLRTWMSGLYRTERTPPEK